MIGGCCVDTLAYGGYSNDYPLIKRADNFRRRYIRHHDRLKPFEDREEQLMAQSQADAAAANGENGRDGRQRTVPSGGSSTVSDEGRTDDSSSSSEEEATANPLPRRSGRNRRLPARWPEGQWTQ